MNEWVIFTTLFRQFISFKYITDGADEQAHEDWEANLADGIEVFKEKVLALEKFRR